MKKSILLLGLLVFAAGCGHVISIVETGYYPHQDGYRWQYTFSTSTTTETTSLTISFNGTTTIWGTIEVQNWVSQTAGSISISYIKVTNDGVYSWGGNTSTAEAQTLQLPLPPTVGCTWRVSSATAEVLARENVTVPAGTFDCYKVRTTSATSYTDYWYGAGAGIVKIATVNPSSSYSATLVLNSKNF